MSTPTRESSLQALEETRAKIEQSLFGMLERLDAYSLPPHAYGAVEASEERLRTFRKAIKLYGALAKCVRAEQRR